MSSTSYRPGPPRDQTRRLFLSAYRIHFKAQFERASQMFEPFQLSVSKSEGPNRQVGPLQLRALAENQRPPQASHGTTWLLSSPQSCCPARPSSIPCCPPASPAQIRSQKSRPDVASHLGTMRVLSTSGSLSLHASGKPLSGSIVLRFTTALGSPPWPPGIHPPSLEWGPRDTLLKHLSPSQNSSSCMKSSVFIPYLTELQTS